MSVTTFAAIDVGSYEVEMVIYEISTHGIRQLDHVRHIIALGRDTYNMKAISYDLVDELVVYQLPFSAGQGIPVLNTFRPQHWELHKTTSFSNGICRLIYRKSCKM